MTDAGKMVKNNFIYMGASLLAQALSVLLVPVYTRNMSVDDFGMYNLMISVQMLLTIFATLGISSGLTRFFNEVEDKNKLKNTALTFVVGAGLLLTLPVAIFSDSIYSHVFGISEEGGRMLIVVMLSTLCLSITNIYSAYYNMYEKAFINGFASVGKSVLLLGISIVLIIYMQMGLMGSLVAQLLAFGIVALILMCADYRKIRIHIEPGMLKPMLKYSLGLIPGQISSWVYNLIDRYFLKAMVGLYSVGVYSMGFKLGALFEPLFLQPFRSVFAAFKYKEYRNEGAREKIHRIFKIYASTAWFAAFGISVFAKPGILVLSTTEYMGAATVVPLVVTAYVINGFDEFYSLGIHLKNLSAIDSIILVLSAGMNIVLNLVLIPLAGMHGAAAATLLSAIAMDIVYYWAGKRYYDLKIGYLEGFKPLPLVIAGYGLYMWFSTDKMGLLENTIISTVACCLFLLLAYLFNTIPRELYHQIFSFVRKRLQWAGQRS